MMMYVFLLNRCIYLFKYLFFQLNTHEFRSVLPAIALSINKDKPKGSKWNRYAREHPGLALYIAAILIGVTAFILAGIFIVVSYIFNYLFNIYLIIKLGIS